MPTCFIHVTQPNTRTQSHIICLYNQTCYDIYAVDPIRLRHCELCRPGSLPQPIRRGAAGAARAVLCGCGGAGVIARVLRVC